MDLLTPLSLCFGMLRILLIVILQLFVQALIHQSTHAQDATASLNFIDVQEGHAILIDVGEYEILIDGGYDSLKSSRTDRNNSLAQYLRRKKLIDGPLDLLIITQSDMEAYGHLQQILKNPKIISEEFENLDSSDTAPPDSRPWEINQIWSLGRLDDIAAKFRNDRCKYGERSRYSRLIKNLENNYGDVLRMPVQEEFETILNSKTFSHLNFDPNFPGKIYLVSAGLSDDMKGKATCAQMRNDASMVIGMEIFGLNILIGGDVSTGYNRSINKMDSPGKEEDILAVIQSMPWFKNVDLLVAPRRGSWTANSPEYIDYIDPRFVLFGASSNHGHPGKSVAENYSNLGAEIYSTAHSIEGGRHDISCLWHDANDLACEYGTISGNKLVWEGRDKDGGILDSVKLKRSLRRARRDRNATERAAYKNSNIKKFPQLTDADLFAVDLSNEDLSFFDFTGADLRYANFSGADLSNVDFSTALLDYAELSNANLNNASLRDSKIVELTAKNVVLEGTAISNVTIQKSDFRGAEFKNTLLEKVVFDKVKLEGALFEPDNFSLTGVARSFKRTDNIDRIEALSTLRFESSPAALQKIRKYFQDTGQKQKEADIIYAIQKSRQAKLSPLGKTFRSLCCELVVEYGRAPNRPLFIIIAGIPIFSFFYVFAVFRRNGGGIFVLQSPAKGPSVVRLDTPHRIHHMNWRAWPAALYFSFLSAFRFGWRDINIGNWAQTLTPKQFNLDATGWVRVVSGFQSLLSFYLIAIWALMLFGNPFR